MAQDRVPALPHLEAAPQERRTRAAELFWSDEQSAEQNDSQHQRT